ncbi:hypothetical protein G4B88_025877 [Cannabis sativa]|uniref:GDSL esterase/lipase n=1 Tax=Cannabis sativa TaxID=3483 RepID=A0A7J6HGX0_CANSA|nr:hypothetical protein G4B88_025877 [Cannabis sativa]
MREVLVLDNGVFFCFFMVMGFLCIGSHGQRIPLFPARRNVSALYVLGDSSVDCGTNTLFYSRLHRNLSLIPCNGADGNLLPHLLAEKMGLPYALSFYTQNGSIGDLMTGLNFGSAQATIMNPSSQGYQSLNQQLRQVFEMMELLQLQLSPNMALRFVRSSVYYLSFGKDDYINFYLSSNSNSGSSVGAPKYSNHEFAHILVSEMINVVRSLHDMKIRKIICQGILPLGCTPRMAFESFDFEASQHRRRGCWEKVNRMVLEFNIMLEEKIIELNEEMPDAHILFFDVYQGIKEIIAKPEHYGFDDVKSACCGLGLYGASIGCLSLEMACNNTRSHVWWDLYNPTKAVNSLLADSAWSGHPFSGLSRPMNIQDLLL